MKHRWHPLAGADFDDAVGYYLTQASPAVARKLDLAVNHALHLVLEHPRIGGGAQTGARKLALQGFPYDLIYRIETNTVIVLAVSSHSRRPGFWAGRRLFWRRHTSQNSGDPGTRQKVSNSTPLGRRSGFTFTT